MNEDLSHKTTSVHLWATFSQAGQFVETCAMMGNQAEMYWSIHGTCEIVTVRAL